MPTNTIELSVRGEQVRVPAVELDGRTVIVTGGWLRIATIHDEDWVSSDFNDIQYCIKKLKEHRSQGFKADIFVVTQKPPHTTPRYAFKMERESIAAIPLSTFDNWWSGLSRKAKQDITRATHRGVSVRVAELDDEFVTGIVGIYNDSPVRQGKAFWHYQKDFMTVKRENSTFQDRSTFIGAYCNDELIGFLKIVAVGPLAVLMQIVSKASQFDKRPSNALIAKAVEHCATLGMSHLIYGNYKFTSGESSLTRFKERVGFEEILVPRFFIPLTAKGRIFLALGLHREIRRMLPGWLIGFLRNLRKMLREHLFLPARPGSSSEGRMDREE